MKTKKPVEALYHRVSNHIDQARQTIQRSINTEMVKAYWQIGREIIEEEQRGELRAEYGKALLKNLSEYLTKKYGRGFSVTNIKNMRQFFIEYQGVADKAAIRYAVRSELAIQHMPKFSPNLSWTHYRILMRVASIDAREFYEGESQKNGWSARELERQVASQLFERLSRNKVRGAGLDFDEEQIIKKPEDILKAPFVLEFLDLPESHQLNESDLEEALLNQLQKFLLELGKGFAFVSRQKRITLDGDHFYVDLVFYHTILKCYIVIDIKTRKLNHGDLGQMLFYTNYFDREVKQQDDQATIGLILCSAKNNKMVEYTLNEKAKQIFASKYQLYLPSEKELEKQIKSIKQRFEGDGK